MRNIILTLTMLLVSLAGKSQVADSLPALLTDMNVQIESTEGINSMYNFDFKRADSQFRWIKSKYPWHPLPDFLLGLSQWWRIMPNVLNEQYDEEFLFHMDSAIVKAEQIYERGSVIEGSFILAAAYAFKGRLYAERKDWGKAASAASSAMGYLEECRGKEEFSPEILFGDGLYNYYIEWIPENYPMLKPIIMFFEDGDKTLGIKQLKDAANNAFYTRTEAQYFLMRIQANELKDQQAALFTADYLHKTYPNNAYFERYYARILYSNGQYRRCQQVAHDILHKIDSAYLGYEANSGRYAAFFLGEVYSARGDYETAKKYFELSIKYGDEIGAQEMGYYIYSVLNLGEIAMKEGNEDEAKDYFKRVKKLSDRGDRSNKLAKRYLKEM
ncbi:tetratricopeptide repeat protein [Reichenbachiella agariperforans]|uniref:tetratricopeptide repeat protein n=1 Tax=Reichenbachiella agariperforans TaxID=156994 RepID=UPI001C0A5EEA|nr:tol-pal system protein YbgF [Reichenbachiella agariperforans]MBU2915213.1 tol-pal system protein YbgF [Reichenbachiella agariperforans]